MKKFSFILILALMLCLQMCKSSEMKVSVLEESKNEVLAAYVTCLRPNTNANNTAGFNIKDCDVLKTRYLHLNEMVTCEKTAPQKKSIEATSSYMVELTAKYLSGLKPIIYHHKPCLKRKSCRKNKLTYYKYNHGGICHHLIV